MKPLRSNGQYAGEYGGSEWNGFLHRSNSYGKRGWRSIFKNASRATGLAFNWDRTTEKVTIVNPLAEEAIVETSSGMNEGKRGGSGGTESAYCETLVSLVTSMINDSSKTVTAIIMNSEDGDSQIFIDDYKSPKIDLRDLQKLKGVKGLLKGLIGHIFRRGWQLTIIKIKPTVIRIYKGNGRTLQFILLD